MKAKDHSDCNLYDCIHKREIVELEGRAEQANQDAEYREAAYYEAKRREKAEAYIVKVHGGTKFGGYADTSPNVSEGGPDESGPKWRARKVALLESELLEARTEQAAHGDSMPLQELRNVVGDALRILERKNEQYGEAWRHQGYMGNLARIQSKCSRLREMLWKDPDGNGYPLPANYTRDDEAIVDTLLDLINLAAMMAVNWEENNRWGKV